MDIGSIADWCNFVATSGLTLAAVVFSIKQYRKQRDPELRVALKSVLGKDDGHHYSGYDLVAINNSEGNCVILQNTTPAKTTDERCSSFQIKNPDYDPDNPDSEELIDTDSNHIDRFRMDKEVLPQNTKTLWRFTYMLRGRTFKNSKAGSTDAMDWYFYDAVNQRHYQVIIRQDRQHHNRLVTELNSSKSAFAKEE